MKLHSFWILLIAVMGTTNSILSFSNDGAVGAKNSYCQAGKYEGTGGGLSRIFGQMTVSVAPDSAPEQTKQILEIPGAAGLKVECHALRGKLGCSFFLDSTIAGSSVQSPSEYFELHYFKGSDHYAVECSTHPWPIVESQEWKKLKDRVLIPYCMRCHSGFSTEREASAMATGMLRQVMEVPNHLYLD
jgi:hypothetical protein